ncbi:MAG: DUF3558 domain-containing protein, partial [Acidimicrobiia bacterium]|nr:DUF3558 domain-containing protein [Acidimicrobiia bacterium]
RVARMRLGIRALMVGAMLLTACTGSSDPTTATSPGGETTDTEAAVATVATTQPPENALDLCELVTQADAEALFGQPVSMPADDLGGFPGQLGVCVWQADGGALLTISLFEGDEFFGAVGQLEGSEPIDLGDGGDILVETGFLGVQIQWLQDGLTVTLNADTLGVDDTATFETDMRELAQAVETGLP